ncbi:MAG: hypothetical protein QG666_1397, partial [Euryarchaeota archaeon]|nr:hypothetical protein [Euryarchaeota archaeon]
PDLGSLQLGPLDAGHPALKLLLIVEVVVSVQSVVVLSLPIALEPDVVVPAVQAQVGVVRGLVSAREREDDHRLNRYDYLYNKEQLESWVPRIKRAELKAAKIRVYFNNHARAKAARNAFQLMDMLAIEHKHKEIRLQDQFTLGEF